MKQHPLAFNRSFGFRKFYERRSTTTTNRAAVKYGRMFWINELTVRAFVNDDVEFRTTVDKQFVLLDTNNDGVLSRSEMRKAFETTRFLETDFGVDKATPPEEVTLLYDSIFRSFYEDNNGTVDIDEFRSEVKKIMLAVADGLGSSPIQMAVEETMTKEFMKVSYEMNELQFLGLKLHPWQKSSEKSF